MVAVCQKGTSLIENDLIASKTRSTASDQPLRLSDLPPIDEPEVLRLSGLPSMGGPDVLRPPDLPSMDEPDMRRPFDTPSSARDHAVRASGRPPISATEPPRRPHRPPEQYICLVRAARPPAREKTRRLTHIRGNPAPGWCISAEERWRLYHDPRPRVDAFFAKKRVGRPGGCAASQIIQRAGDLPAHGFGELRVDFRRAHVHMA